MKIVILNNCFFKNGHLDRLRKLGELTIYDDTDSEEKAIERLARVDIAIADYFATPLNEKVFNATDSLKFISLNTTGFEGVDLITANKKGVKIANVPGFSTDAVAEHTIGLMFAVIRKIPLGDREVRNNPFEIDPMSKSHTKFCGFNIRGKTLGVIGLGHIGQRVAELGVGLAMNVVAYNKTSRDMQNVKLVSLEELLKTSDVVSLHLPLLKETENIISEKELDLMKPTAILINTARGKLINTQALYSALKNGKITGAGLDVLAENNSANPLLELDNIVFTPHSGFYTEESIDNMAEIVVQNVEAFVKGSPTNVVNL